MIQELKRCFKLFRYAYGFKSNVVGAVLMFLVALLCIFGGSFMRLTGYVASAIFMFISFVMVVQLKDNYLFSRLVMSSPRKRCLEIGLTDLLILVAGIGSYLLNGLLVFLLRNSQAYKDVPLVSIFLVAGITITSFIIDYAFANRYYVFSMVMMILGYFFAGFFASDEYLYKMGSLVGNNAAYGFLAGGAIVVAGVFLSMGIRRLLYKKPLSLHVGSMGLRKAMQ